MQVNIKINCDNAAMVQGDEPISEVLRRLSEKLEGIEIQDLEDTTLYDLNGNKILWLTVEQD